MPNKSLLSVAIVVQNHKEVIEETLTSLFELSTIPFELYLIDDGSTDGSGEVIQSLLDYYQHEQTFYYSHRQPIGRGNALIEAILQCNGNLFWAPKTIHSINEDILAQRLEQLADSTKVALLQQQDVPENQYQWRKLISENKWPVDGNFIWNCSQLQSAGQFFNPLIEQYHALELAARLEHQTFGLSDQQWYKANSLISSNSRPTVQLRQELLFTLLRSTKKKGNREKILTQLSELDQEQSAQTFNNDALNEALRMKQEGRFNAALELVESVMENHPNHTAARNLKIEILEKKRRFVEASELKHEATKSHTQSPQEIENEEETSDTKEVEVSIIIPTTTYGKPALEHCLLSISEQCDTSQLELIVIDNASLDDTHDYLDELKEKNFLHCQVITNEQNAGFAASVNQGLKKADGKYACIIHNDIEFTNDAITQLRQMMDNNPDYAIIGPSTNKTLNPDQATRNVEDSDPKLMRAEYLDSFCMMIRREKDLSMDTDYELAFFEDIDLCFQARSNGHKIGITPHVEVTHHFGTTTFSLDLDTESEQYWKNVSYFNQKWGIEVFSEDELKSLSTFDQLLALDTLVNPIFPEEEIQKQFNKLFTDELKTEIFNTQHDAETLCQLVHLFMVMEEREVMRRLEDRLENIELPASLIYQLVRFYYNRNIYSRCTHYLKRLKPQNESLRADLYRLAILVENKDMEAAIPMLRDLMEHAPANPMLYKLAGDIHIFNGNKEEAHSFYDLAEQINPFEFANEQKDAFGFKL